MTAFRWLLIFLAFDIGLRASHAAGVPTWRDWPPGDAHDVGFLCGLIVYFLTQRRVPTPPKAEAEHG